MNSKTCIDCKKSYEIKPNANNQKRCIDCRKTKEKLYRKQWQLLKRKKYAPNKIECLICGGFYRQVGSHIFQTHKITAREYREQFNLEVKKGILPPDLREHKGKIAIENGTYKNLANGKKYWFKKGQSYNYKRSPITIARLIEQGKRIGKKYGRINLKKND